MSKDGERRAFIKGAAVTAAAGGLFATGCGSKPEGGGGAPSVSTRKKIKWKMCTTWGPGFPVMGEGAQMLAKWIGEMSQGDLEVKVFGAGELVGAMEVFDAVSQGTAQMGHSAAYYWAGKIKAAQFFAAVPFGMNAQQMNAWLYGGGGLELWREIYAPLNLVPFPAGNTGVQMGGWFRKEIKSIADLNGLVMRIPGLGGDVLKRAGGTPRLSAGGEIYTDLDRGVIDATEWVGPYHDFLMGFYKIAKNYYYPGWHEPGTVLELTVNKTEYDKLPKDLQAIVEAAAARANVWMLSEFESKNNEYLSKLVSEHGVKLHRFPDDVLAELKKLTGEVLAEITAEDEQSKRVYESFSTFQKNVGAWAELSEKAYHAL
jgi:TRAP-type mannitol/chloroaromatic compound transport system substrate-binding protein